VHAKFSFCTLAYTAIGSGLMFWAFASTNAFKKDMESAGSDWPGLTQVPQDWQKKSYASIAMLTTEEANGKSCSEYFEDSGGADTLVAQVWPGTEKGYCIDDCVQVSTE